MSDLRSVVNVSADTHTHTQDQSWLLHKQFPILTLIVITDLLLMFLHTHTHTLHSRLFGLIACPHKLTCICFFCLHTCTDGSTGVSEGTTRFSAVDPGRDRVSEQTISNQTHESVANAISLSHWLAWLHGGRLEWKVCVYAQSHIFHSSDWLAQYVHFLVSRFGKRVPANNRNVNSI